MVLMLWEVADCFLNFHKLNFPQRLIMKRHVETFGVITRLFSLGDKQQKEKNVSDNF